MTDGVDRDLLLFAAAHELVLAQQAAALLQITDNAATDQLERLRAERLLTRVTLTSQLPAAYRITPDGTSLVDSALPPLRAIDWPRYRHEIATGWVWASAYHGSLGQFRQVLSRRLLQAADTTQRSATLLDTPGATFSDPPRPDARLDARHAYPDLGLIAADGGWVSVHLILSPPDPRRLKTSLARAGRDRLLLAQLYLVQQDARIDEAIKTTAEQLGLADKIHVRLLAENGIAGA